MTDRASNRLRTRGMALINALIVVAALAAVSLALLVRTDAARQRLGMRIAADQAALYLDAAELLARRLVEESAQAEYVHDRQAWAIARMTEPIDRGTVGWRLEDLQGRFNINWLSRTDSTGEAARIAFPLLARAQGVPSEVATRLRTAADPMSLFRESAFGGGSGVSSPPPLPLAVPGMLRLVVGAGDDRLDRLLPFIAALPSDTALNINTLKPEVLSAFVPTLDARALAELSERRREAPFMEVSYFLEWAQVVFGEEQALALEALDLSTGSEWFEALLIARLDTIALQRSAVLRRREDTGRSEIIYSMPEVD